MSKFLKAAALALTLALPMAPAFAESSSSDWIENAFRHSEGRALSRAQRSDDGDEGTVRRHRAARVARSESNEEDVRPQRRAATKPRPRESLSGGEGQFGVASYYWEPQALASGGRFNPNAMTAAHKTLPFGTRVRVTRVDNGQSVTVVINDRGPYVGGRIIDLSRRAAQELNMTGAGVAKVRVAVLGR